MAVSMRCTSSTALAWRSLAASRRFTRDLMLRSVIRHSSPAGRLPGRAWPVWAIVRARIRNYWPFMPIIVSSIFMASGASIQCSTYNLALYRTC